MFGSGSSCGLPVLLTDVSCKTLLAKLGVGENETKMTEDSLNIEVIQNLSRINRRLFLMCLFVLAIAPVAGKSLAGVFLNSAKRCARSGEAVKLLSNINDQYKDASLYNENESNIASWKDATNEVGYIDRNYRGRIHMDEKRNIWILGVERSDAGKYFVKFGIDDERLDIELTVKEEPTEEQLQECQNNRQDSPKEGFGRSSSEDYKITLILMFMVFTWVIVLMDRGRKLFIFVYSQCKRKTLTAVPVQRWPYDNPDFKEKYLDDRFLEQMQQCLGAYPVLMEKYLGNLTEDQIGEQIQKLLSVYPGLFMKKFLERLMEDQVKKWLYDNPDFMEKYHDQNGIHPINQPTREGLADSLQGKVISHKMCGDSGSDLTGILPISRPTLEELGVTQKKVGNETEDNQTPLVSTKGKLINPKKCGDSGSDQPENQKLPLKPVDAGTKRKVNQGQLVSSKEELVTSQTGFSPNSDQPENDHQVFKTAHSQLSLTPVDARTERKDNQKKWISSEDKLVTSQTGISPSSDIFSEPGHSGIQPFNKDEQNANPEGDMAQTDVESLGVLLKEDTDSLPDEESREPLLMDYGDQKLRCDKRKPSSQYKKSPD